MLTVHATPVNTFLMVSKGGAMCWHVVHDLHKQNLHFLLKPSWKLRRKAQNRTLIRFASVQQTKNFEAHCAANVFSWLELEIWQTQILLSTFWFGVNCAKHKDQLQAGKYRFILGFVTTSYVSLQELNIFKWKILPKSFQSHKATILVLNLKIIFFKMDPWIEVIWTIYCIKRKRLQLKHCVKEVVFDKKNNQYFSIVIAHLRHISKDTYIEKAHEGTSTIITEFWWRVIDRLGIGWMKSKLQKVTRNFHWWCLFADDALFEIITWLRGCCL